MFLTVTNNSKQDFTGRFDGVDYPFKPGTPITISADAARHIFGVGLADKTDILTKHGWLTHSTGKDAAMERLGQFAFSIPGEELTAEEPEVIEPKEMEKKEEKPSMIENIEQGSAPLQPEGGIKSDSDGSEEIPSTVSNGGETRQEKSMLGNLGRRGGRN